MPDQNCIREIAAGNKDLPTLPGIAIKILETIRNANTGIDAIGDLIANDPPLSAKVLKLVNSPFYGLPSKVTSVHTAINLLGSHTIKNIALSFSLVGSYQNKNGNQFDYPLFWKNSLISAITAKLLTQNISPALAEDAFFLGLIHDIGILALLQCFGNQYQQVLTYKEEEGCSYQEAENQILQFNHLEMGNFLTKSWGLPKMFYTPIRYHHHPFKLRDQDPELHTLTQILHLASLFADFYNQKNKTLYLSLFEWYVKEYEFGPKISFDQLYKQIHAQAQAVFPLFEVRLESTESYDDIIARARKELDQLAANTTPSLDNGHGGQQTSEAARPATDQKTILIVDDEVRNITLLKAMLMSDEHHLAGALSGEEALQAIVENPPDLILLDVMMPGIDGFEVCRRLKANQHTQMIPILMVTALNRKEHRVKAMEVGADDFLSKPIDRTELQLRARSLLRIKAYHDQLLERHHEITRKNAKLEELEKVKEGLTHMVIHDMKNPLMGLAGYLELLLFENNDLTADQTKLANRCFTLCEELNQMIQSLLEVHKMENDQIELHKETLDISVLVKEVFAQFEIQAQKKNICLSFETKNNSAAIQADRVLIKRVLANLINNALRHTPAGGSISIWAQPAAAKDQLCLSVFDTGSGLIGEDKEKIFDKFKQAENGTLMGSSGLGLAFCKLAVEAHGGKIWADNQGAKNGAIFSFSLPN